MVEKGVAGRGKNGRGPPAGFGVWQPLERAELLREVFRKVITDVPVGRATVLTVKEAERIEGLRISLLVVVDEKDKIRVIHDVTFKGPRVGAGRESRRSVTDTDWEQVPECELGGV